MVSTTGATGYRTVSVVNAMYIAFPLIIENLLFISENLSLHSEQSNSSKLFPLTKLNRFDIALTVTKYYGIPVADLRGA